MMRFTTFKIVAILLACFYGAYLALPNLLTTEQISSLRQSLPNFMFPGGRISLGLDLRGGSHLAMEIDEPELLKSEVRHLQGEVRKVLRAGQIPITGGVGMQPRGIQVRIPDADKRAAAKTALQQVADAFLPNLNLFGTQSQPATELTEGADGLFQITITEFGLRQKMIQYVDQAIPVLQQRIDPAGTLEASITREGASRVILQVPGVEDPTRLEELAGKIAKLEFRMVANPGADPATVETLKDEEGRELSIERDVIVEGSDLTSAEGGFEPQTGEPVVNFGFNVAGAQAFGAATTNNVGRLFAIVLDGVVISAPRINTPIQGGRGFIEGNFTPESARDLSTLLRSGSLPAKFTVEERRVVGAGLGQDSIDAAVVAAWVSGALIVAFTIATYGFFGVIALIALVVNVILILGIMSVLGSTLTLPGIAGLILTVAMAVDSNVLIYERVREEARLGRSVLSSLDQGFERALATIIDANLTTLLAAGILFWLGSGPVRGFAVTLSLGIFTTIFTAFTLTRLMVALWFRYAKPKALTI
jgi:protein-export membrane protein SecD